MVLDKQATANSQIQGGLMLVNQQINLVQEQLDILWQMAKLGCEQSCLAFVSLQYNMRILQEQLTCHKLCLNIYYRIGLLSLSRHSVS